MVHGTSTSIYQFTWFIKETIKQKELTKYSAWKIEGCYDTNNPKGIPNLSHYKTCLNNQALLFSKPKICKILPILEFWLLLTSIIMWFGPVARRKCWVANIRQQNIQKDWNNVGSFSKVLIQTIQVTFKIWTVVRFIFLPTGQCLSPNFW